MNTATAFDCGHQGETDCYGQCIAWDLYEALKQLADIGEKIAVPPLEAQSDFNRALDNAQAAIAKAEEE